MIKATGMVGLRNPLGNFFVLIGVGLGLGLHVLLQLAAVLGYKCYVVYIVRSLCSTWTVERSYNVNEL
jgi:hypothetical protein